MVSISNVPPTAHVIGSHVIYKVRVEDENVLYPKARIAPHGNDGRTKSELRLDCAMCSPIDTRVLISTATLHGWDLHRRDVKSTFLRTGNAELDV